MILLAFLLGLVVGVALCGALFLAACYVEAVCAAADATRRREIVRRLAGAVTIANHRIEVRLRLPAEWIRSSNRDRADSNSERLAGRLVVLVPGGRDVPLHRRRTA